MRDGVTEQRVSDLEHRVERIERRLQMNSVLRDAEAQRAERDGAPVRELVDAKESPGLRCATPRGVAQRSPGDGAPAPPRPPQPRPPRASEIFFGAPTVSPAPTVAPAPVAPPPRTAPPAPVLPIAPFTPAPIVSSSPTPPAPRAPPTPVLPYQPTPAPLPPPAQTDIEQPIGLRWAGWVGAVVLVIGAGLGIKYAYDQGWFELVPASLRLAMMSLGSFALIGAGEWVRRKISDAAAVGLFGAGVATLFLVAYAGHGYLELYQP